MYERLVTNTIFLCSCAATAWGFLHLFLYRNSGRWAAYAIPFSYPLVALPLLGIIKFCKDPTARMSWVYNAGAAHVALLILLPCALMAEMGGFSNSGGVVIWASMGPPTALRMFSSGKMTFASLLLYLVSTVAAFAFSTLEEMGLISLRSRPDMHKWEIMITSFATSVGVCTYASLVMYMLQQQVLAQNSSYEALLSNIVPPEVARTSSTKSEEMQHGFLPMVKTMSRRWSTTSSPRWSTHSDHDGQCTPTDHGPHGPGTAPVLASKLLGISARHHPNVTLISLGVVGFSAMTKQIQPSKVVKFLDKLYAHLDKEAMKFGLCKVRTIGETYLAAAGILCEFDVAGDSESHALRTLLFGLSIQGGALGDIRMPNGSACELQVGVASGSLFSGVVGRRQAQFDVFGHLVELTSGVRQNCGSACVQMTEECWRQARESINAKFPSLKKIDVELVRTDFRSRLGVTQSMLVIRAAHNMHIFPQIQDARVAITINEDDADDSLIENPAMTKTVLVKSKSTSLRGVSSTAGKALLSGRRHSADFLAMDRKIFPQPGIEAVPHLSET